MDDYESEREKRHADDEARHKKMHAQMHAQGKALDKSTSDALKQPVEDEKKH